MSFNDISSNKSSSTRAAAPLAQSAPTPTSSLDTRVNQIAEALKRFQVECNVAKQSVDDLKRRPITPENKLQVDNRIKSLKQTSEAVRIKIETYIKSIDELPRDEAASRRVASVKLQKDFDRVKTQYNDVLKNHSSIKVNASRGSVTNGGGGGGDSNELEPSDSRSFQPKLVQTLQGQDVEDAIIEERERDIKKINEDLVLVNEMFRDMAHIVEKQGVVIDKVAESAESSRERAEAGLGQLNQAAAYQPGCFIS